MGKNLQLLWPSKRRHPTPRRCRVEIKAMCNNSSYSVALFAKAFCCVDVYLLRQLINSDFIEALCFQILSSPTLTSKCISMSENVARKNVALQMNSKET